MIHTVKRALALVMALMLIMSTCAFAAEVDGTVETVETVETETIDEPAEPAAEVPADIVDEVPEESEDFIGEEEAVEEVEEEFGEAIDEEIVAETETETVTGEAMADNITDEAFHRRILFGLILVEIDFSDDKGNGLMARQVNIVYRNSESESPYQIYGVGETAKIDAQIDISDMIRKSFPEARENGCPYDNPITKGTVLFNSATSTLTLDNATIEMNEHDYAILCGDSTPITICLKGSNTIKSADTAFMNGNSSIGKTIVDGEDGSSLTIRCRGTGIGAGANLTINGGNIDIISESGNGIICFEEFVFNGGSLTSFAQKKGVNRGQAGLELRGVTADKFVIAPGSIMKCGSSASDKKEVTPEDYVWYFSSNNDRLDPPAYFEISLPEKEEAAPAPAPASAPAPAEATGLIVASMKTSGKNALKLTWTPIYGAEGYDVFMTYCGEHDYSIVATAAGTARGATVKKLKKYTAYKAFVRAWQTVNGQKVYITAPSPRMHAITGGFTKNYTNPRKITVKKSKFTLKAGKSAKIKAGVKLLKGNRRLLAHESKVRYFSSDPAVATVNARGRISAVAPGTCKIYVIAINGLRKAVTVKVK